MLNLPVDESEDGLIHCFKEKEPCAAGKDLLKAQMEVFRDMESSEKPFSCSSNAEEVTDLDIEDAMNVDFLLDEDDEEDDDVDTVT